MKKLLQDNPNKFIEKIEKEIGPYRLRLLKFDMDKYQVFWLGILEAVHYIDENRDPIPFLISKGYGNIRNYMRTKNSRRYVKYCQLCGRYYGYRRNVSCKCGNSLEVKSRKIQYIDMYPDDNNEYDKIDNMIVCEEFIKTLSGKIKIVAIRWLIDKLEYFYEDSTKRIANELGISIPMVSKYRRKIRQKFKKWYERR